MNTSIVSFKLQIDSNAECFVKASKHWFAYDYVIMLSSSRRPQYNVKQFAFAKGKYFAIEKEWKRTYIIYLYALADNTAANDHICDE